MTYKLWKEQTSSAVILIDAVSHGMGRQIKKGLSLREPTENLPAIGQSFEFLRTG